MTLVCAAAWAQGRTVAITVDDLPYVGGNGTEAQTGNRRLLDVFRAHRVPVTGFVIQKRVEDLGPAGPAILAQWTRAGLQLGNHSYEHRDANTMSVEEIEDQIVRGEGGRKVRWFRFPMNHTGDTAEKRDAVAAFLAKRGYRLAVCTIENEDYLFNAAYVRILAKNDEPSASRLRKEYLAFTAAEIDWYAALNKQVLGYEPPEVMLLHDDRLNSELAGDILKMFEDRGYRFVTLDAAMSDAAYKEPDRFVTKSGPMWGYRWARERGVKVNGSAEPQESEWIRDWAKAEHE